MATTITSFMQRLWAAAKDEWCFLANSPWDLALVSWMPLLTVTIFAAMFFSSVPRALPIAVVDDSHSDISRELIRSLQAAPALDVVATPNTVHEAWSLMRSMRVNAVFYIPADTEPLVVSQQSAPVFAFYNATFTTAGGTAFRDMSAALTDASQSIVLTQIAFTQGLQVLKAAPVSAQVNVLYNPGRNFEIFLLGILLPGVLLLMLCAAITAAFGREVRDGTVAIWLARYDGHLGSAVLGKMLPYVGLYWLYGTAALVWVAYVRGDGVAGSLPLLLLGTWLFYLAYAALGFMLVAVTRTMADAFSMVGLYVGTAVAFSGSTFPIDGAPLFARIWHQLVPLSTYLKLDAAERYMDADLAVSLGYVLVLALFVVIPLGIGGLAYRRKIHHPESWGQR